MQACQTVLAQTGLLNGQSLSMPAKHGNNVEAAWTFVFSIDLAAPKMTYQLMSLF